MVGSVTTTFRSKIITSHLTDVTFGNRKLSNMQKPSTVQQPTLEFPFDWCLFYVNAMHTFSRMEFYINLHELSCIYLRFGAFLFEREKKTDLFVRWYYFKWKLNPNIISTFQILLREQNLKNCQIWPAVPSNWALNHRLESRNFALTFSTVIEMLSVNSNWLLQPKEYCYFDQTTLDAKQTI